MVDVVSLDPLALEKFLERQRANPPHFPLEMSLADNLVEVLRKANQFVPSEAGSILLDDPRSKHRDRRLNSLTFLAAFGVRAESILGQVIPSNHDGRVEFTASYHLVEREPCTMSVAESNPADARRQPLIRNA